MIPPNDEKAPDLNDVLKDSGEAAVRDVFDNAAATDPPTQHESVGANGNAPPHIDQARIARPYSSRCMADIEPQPVDWLWPQRFARGKVGLLAGQPGGGKSQLTLFLAATVSIGGHWPDGATCAQGSVVIVSCEDDVADTVVPRLAALGADLSKVHTLDWVRRRRNARQLTRHLFDLGQDIDKLEALVSELKNVPLIIIDPISAYLGRLDSHKASDVRGALAPLQDLAARTKAAILIVSHLNKSTVDTNAMARVAGSGAFVAACRSAWLVENDPQDDTRKRRILAPLKNNIGDDRTGFVFRIESTMLVGGIETSRVQFEPGTIEVTASELLRAQQTTDEERSALDEAVDFLRELLTEGAKTAKHCQDAARAAGISSRTLRRAREKLRIRPSKSQKTGSWIWSLPASQAASE